MGSGSVRSRGTPTGPTNDDLPSRTWGVFREYCYWMRCYCSSAGLRTPVAGRVGRGKYVGVDWLVVLSGGKSGF